MTNSLCTSAVKNLCTTFSMSCRLKVPQIFSLTEIMSGDLLEDLMSSEGEFGEGEAENSSGKREGKKCEFISHDLLSITYIFLISFSVFHLQCSRLSSVCPLHPAITTTYTTWMRQKAFVTSLTSPFSTSDP